MSWGARSGALSYGKGRFLTGQGDAVWLPPKLTRRYPILYMPPGFDIATSGIDPVAMPGENKLLGALRRAGAIVAVCDWDIGSGATPYGSSWGAPLIRTYIDTVRTGLPAVAASLGLGNASLLDVSKVVMVAGSQGAADCYSYAAANPTRVQAIGTWAGVTDLTGFYTGTYRWGGDNGTASQAAIAACWGVTPPAALPASADPYDNAAAVTCPVLLTYSDGDTTVTAASQKAMAAALPNGQAVAISASDTHGDTEAGDAASTLASWALRQAA